ncbi:uncharacterized protein Tco025E_05813 [Trypanosoma conorhini]|uniref:Uncharacterized protein n=1 Tax=Trypanosoma conorhini TaxID=83891 RepID=A0A3R7LI34_9TRYP|nr:uncharacterized protein Tco025E_05813 [Trypanosoma conorhini]RNF14889.1 hypothetical protein Tco025E_05813 [Trypanosoma conorhini]
MQTPTPSRKASTALLACGGAAGSSVRRPRGSDDDAGPLVAGDTEDEFGQFFEAMAAPGAAAAGGKTAPASSFNGHASTPLRGAGDGEEPPAPTATSLAVKNGRKKASQYDHATDGAQLLPETPALIASSSPTIHRLGGRCTTSVEGNSSAPERGATMSPASLEVSGADERSVGSCTSGHIHAPPAPDRGPKPAHTAALMGPDTHRLGSPPHNDGAGENVTALRPPPRLSSASGETEGSDSGARAAHLQGSVEPVERADSASPATPPPNAVGPEVDDDDDEFGEFVEVALGPGAGPPPHAMEEAKRQPVNEVARREEDRRDEDGADGGGDEEEEEEEWSAFADAVAPSHPQLRRVASAEDARSPECAGQFVFHRDLDVAAVARHLRELTGCVLERERGRSHGGVTEQAPPDAVCRRGGEPKARRSRGELLLAVMESLSFTRLGAAAVADGATPPLGSSVGGPTTSPAPHNLPGWLPSFGERCGGGGETPQPQPKPLTLSLVDPIVALRISDRRTPHRREQLESVLLQASQLRLHAVPVSEAIAKARELATEYQQQLQQRREKEEGHSNVENGSVWEIHPTLPTPCIGGSLFPAPSLRLPL